MISLVARTIFKFPSIFTHRSPLPFDPIPLFFHMGQQSIRSRALFHVSSSFSQRNKNSGEIYTDHIKDPELKKNLEERICSVRRSLKDSDYHFREGRSERAYKKLMDAKQLADPRPSELVKDPLNLGAYELVDDVTTILEPLKQKEISPRLTQVLKNPSPKLTLSLALEISLLKEQEVLHEAGFSEKLRELYLKIEPGGQVLPRQIYMAYAHPHQKFCEEEQWIKEFLDKLHSQLKDAGCEPFLDDLDVPRSGSPDEYMEDMKSKGIILLFGSKSLRLKNDRGEGVHAISRELGVIKDLISRRRRGEFGLPHVMPILLSGEIETSFPKGYKGFTNILEWPSEGYFKGIRDILAGIYGKEMSGYKAEVFNKHWNDRFENSSCKALAESFNGDRLEAKKNLGSKSDFPYPAILAGICVVGLGAAYWRYRPDPKQLSIEGLKTRYLENDKLRVLNLNKNGGADFELPIENVYQNALFSDEAKSSSKTVIEPKDIWNGSEIKNQPKKRVLIYGNAGTGKSVFSQWVSYQWAKGELWNDVFDIVLCIPLRNLKNYSRPDLYKIIRQECRLDTSIFHQEEIKNKTLLILDGYDELSPGSEETFKEFAKEFPHLLVTSRTLRVTEFNPSVTLEIPKFNDEEIDTYIDRYFESCPANGIEQNEKEAKKALLKSKLQEPNLRSLSSIPINLVLLCSYYMAGGFVNLRSESLTITSLYKEITDWLCKRFLLKERKGSETDILNLHNPFAVAEVKVSSDFLEKLSHEGLMKGEFSFKIEINDLGKLKELRELGLFSIKNQVGEFIHNTFQEYFAAKHLAHFYVEGKRKEGKEELKDIKFRPHYLNVLPMAAGYLSLEEDKKPLKDFYEDFFDEPHDKALGYELILLGRCFEECSQLEGVPQYLEFIKRVVDYNEIVPLESMACNILRSHQKISRSSEFDRLSSKKKDVKRLVSQLLEAKCRLPESILSYFTEEIIKKMKDALSVKNPVFRPSSTDLGKMGDLSMDSGTVTEVFSLGKSAGELHEDPQPVLDQSVAKTVENQIPIDDQDVRPDDAISPGKSDEKSDIFDIPKDVILDPSVWREAADLVKWITISEREIPEKISEIMISIFKNAHLDSSVYVGVADILEDIAISGQKIPEKVLEGMVSMFENADLDQSVLQGITKALWQVARSGQEIPEEALKTMVRILKDAALDSGVRKFVVYAFGEMAKGGQKIPEEVPRVMLGMLKDAASDPSDLGAMVCFLVETAIAEISISGQKIPEETLEVVVSIFKNAALDPIVREQAIYALVGIAISRQEISKGALEAIVNILKNTASDSFIRNWRNIVLERFLRDSNTRAKRKNWETRVRKKAAYALKQIARSGHKVPAEILEVMVSMLKDAVLDLSVRREVAFALGAMARNRQKIPEETLEVMVNILKDAILDPSIRETAALSLVEVARSGQKISEKALRGIVSVLEDAKLDSSVRTIAAHTFAEIARSGQKIPEEVSGAIISMFEDAALSLPVRGEVVTVLWEIARSGQKIPEEALKAMVSMFKNPALDRSVWLIAAYTLGEIGRSGQKIPEEVPKAIVSMFKDATLHPIIQGLGAFVLLTMVRSGQEISKETLEILVGAVEGTSMGRLVKAEIVQELAQLYNELIKKDSDLYGLKEEICYLTQQACYEKEIAQPVVYDHQRFVFQTKVLERRYYDSALSTARQMAQREANLDDHILSKMICQIAFDLFQREVRGAFLSDDSDDYADLIVSTLESRENLFFSDLKNRVVCVLRGQDPNDE